ncbi:MAG TPA: hypothetical protein VJM14_05825 [Burkholderiales bacterium]|nr:hypothetical protein [Burkholderiales bacterium]
MMAKRHFAVLALGVPERELRILDTTFLISQGRASAYAPAAEPPPGDPDIVVVDGESDEALAAWASSGHRYVTPTLFLGKQDASCVRSAVVPRPLQPTRILAALDDLTRRFGKAVPELIRRPPTSV